MVREHETQWSLPISQLSMKPGKTQDIHKIIMPAPSGIGDSLVNIPEGSDVLVNGMLESLADGILFTGSFSANFDAECTRCLEPIHEKISVHPVVFFTYENDDTPQNMNNDEEIDIIASQDETPDTYPIRPSSIYLDLENVIRDFLAQALPMQPLDRDDCLGLCSQCGINLNEQPDHKHTVVNIQWAALEGLKAQLEAQESHNHDKK